MSLYRFKFGGQVLLDDAKGEVAQEGLAGRVRSALQDRLNKTLGTGVSVDIQLLELVEPGQTQPKGQP